MILTCTIRFPLLNATEIVRKMLNFIYVRSIYIFFFWKFLESKKEILWHIRGWLKLYPQLFLMQFF